MPNKFDVPALLSADQAKALAKQNELAASLYAPGQSIAQMRVGYETERAWWNVGGPEIEFTDRAIATRHGDVPCRFYTHPQAQLLENAPLIFFIHGGGFALGSVKTHDRICRVLAHETQCNVISIDYTLSPEAKYPQAIEECADVVQYVRDHATQLSLNADTIAYAGDSGGAHMSLATYLYLRDHASHGAERDTACFLLFYGWYGLRDSASFRSLGGTWDGLTAQDFAMYKSLYMASPADAEKVYVDLLSNDLSELPPAYILAAELDPLRDDSAALATAYQVHGIKHLHVVEPGVIHGFMHHGRIVAAVGERLAQAGQFLKEVIACRQ